jgi:hypothetical protein
MFEDMVLSRMFGSNRDEETGGWRKMCNKKLRQLNYALNIKVIKLGRLSLTGHVASTGRCEVHTNV